MSGGDIVLVNVNIGAVVKSVSLNLLLVEGLLAHRHHTAIVKVRTTELHEGALLLGSRVGGPRDTLRVGDTLTAKVVLVTNLVLTLLLGDAKDGGGGGRGGGGAGGGGGGPADGERWPHDGDGTSDTAEHFSVVFFCFFFFCFCVWSVLLFKRASALCVCEGSVAPSSASVRFGGSVYPDKANALSKYFCWCL